MDSTPDLPPVRCPLSKQRTRVDRDPGVGNARDYACPNLSPISRYARHLAALVAVALVLMVSQVDLSTLALSVSSDDPLLQQRTHSSLPSFRGGERAASGDPSPFLLAMVETEVGKRVRPVAPPTLAAEPSPSPSPSGIGGYYFPDAYAPYPTATSHLSRTEIITYEVQAGDIVGTIARQFGISEDTVAWANGRLADNPDYLRIGQHLYILPVSGVMHIVDKGDTLGAIAKQYKANIEKIIAFEGNGLQESSILVEEQVLVIPDGKKPYVPRVVHAWQGTAPKGASKGSGSFVWPTTGVLTQKYWSKHLAIDIGWTEGTPVIAADSGYVSLVGNSPTGYGRYVIINHGNGYSTLYSHFKMYFVTEGQSVAKGEQIGLMGNTGRSTGPHLHFEIRKGGTKVNPLSYLP